MTQIDRANSPKINEIGNFSLPSPKRDKLKNGIKTYCFENPNLDLIYIMLQIRTGSLHQPKKHVCQYAYMLLRESSPRFSSEEIAEKLDFYGSNITTTVSLDKAQILISVPKRNIGDILPIISEFLIHPKYNEKSLSLFKQKEIKNLAYNEQKNDFCSWRLMWRDILGNTFREIGRFSSPDLINSIGLDELDEFHKRSFCAENTTLFYTGDIDSATESTITSAFAEIPSGIASPTLPKAVHEGRPDPIFQKMPDSMQSSIIIARLSDSYNSPERTRFSVLNTITGGYFGSRLMQNLRERQGLTYGVFSSSSYFADQSVFAISSEVNAKDTNKAIDACFEEMRKLQEEPVSEEELETVKNYMYGLNLRAIDTSVNSMQKFAYFCHFGLDEHELTRYISEIKEVTPEDVQLLAKKNFNYNKFSRIIVGEYCEKEL